LQSFPDDFEFIGPSPKVIAFMVGAAVPPLLGRAFGFRIARLLSAYNRRLAQLRSKRNSRA
jgi:site-specific DNA-cytosine methylase